MKQRLLGNLVCAGLLLTGIGFILPVLIDPTLDHNPLAALFGTKDAVQAVARPLLLIGPIVFISALFPWCLSVAQGGEAPPSA